MKRIIAIILILTLLLIASPASASSGIEIVDRVGDGTWIGDTWEVNVFPGESKATTLTLYNSFSESAEVELGIMPDSLDNGNLLFELDKSTFTMSGGSYTNVTLTVKASGSATPGTYTAELEIKSVAPPSVATSAATSVTTSGAILNGNVGNLGTALSVDVSFEWGVTPAYGSETTAEAMTSTGSFSSSLSGLSPNTTYHFRAKAVGDGTGYGADRSFTTGTRAVAAGVGGFGPRRPPPGTTDVGGKVSDACVFLRSVTAISEDGLCTLTIPEGTVGLTEELECLTEISMLIMDEPPPPPENAYVIGLVMDFQPSGATFEPPITLECNYDPSDIPEGIAEEDLVFAYYDEEAGEWVQLEGCVVDPEADTITAPVSHFTAFGIMVFIPAPAAFTFSALEISPAEVEIGDTITISALVENTGEKLGVLRVTLNINGTAEEVKYLTLEPGARTRVSFTTSRDVAGSYSVDVDGLISSFTVKALPPPPELPPPEEVPPPAVNWYLIDGIIAGVVCVGLVVFFLIRRRAQATRQ